MKIKTVTLLFITAVPNTKLCPWGEEDSGGRGVSPVVVYYYAAVPNLWGEEKSGGHVL